MNKQTFTEQLNHKLNNAFSINYIVLQNLEKLMPAENGNVFVSSDIFRKKSLKEVYFEENFKEFAEIRNNYFDKLRCFFAEEKNLQSFQEISSFLIETYNSVMLKNIKYSDIFSDRDIKNWDLFNKVYADVENFNENPSFNKIILELTLAEFLSFYDQYKDWLSAFEIFETLENDITRYGAKSLYFGKPTNPDVYVLDLQDFNNYSKNILEFLKKIKKKSTRKINYNSEKSKTANELIEESACISLYEFFDKINKRFEFANTHLMKHGGFSSKLRYFLSPYANDNFKIEKIYVHKNEILSMISLMSVFPELNEITQQISQAFFDKNVDFSQNTQKENT